MYKLLFFIFVANISYASQIIDTLNELTHYNLKAKYSLTEAGSNLIAALDCFKNNESPTISQKVIELTPDEAEQNFNNYVQQALINSELDAKNFFTEKFFGFPKQNNDVQYIINNDENLIYILECLQRGQLNYIKSYRERLSLRILLMKPQQLFEACINNQKYGHLLNPKDFKSYAQTYPLNIESFFSSKYLGVPDDPIQRNKHFLTNGIGFFSPFLCEEIFENARMIMRYSDKGDNLVILGSTPYFIGRALTFLSFSGDRNIIYFPLSGAPNSTRLRNNEIANENIVTPDRYKHFKKRLQDAGLSKHNPKLVQCTTHFIDSYRTGGGTNYIAGVILHDYRKEKIKPNFNIFCLNSFAKVSDDLIMTTEPIDIQNPPKTLCFAFPTKYSPQFKIPARMVYFRYHNIIDGLLGILPNNNLFNNDWRVLPECHAFLWHHNYNYRLTTNYAEHTLILLEHFDANMRNLIKKDLKNNAILFFLKPL